MDIYCSFCREPWSLDHLHDVVSERFPSAPWMVHDKPIGQTSYQRREGQDFAGMWHDQKIYETYFEEVKKDFRMRGCVALGGSAKWCDDHANPRNAIMGQLMDFAGDDIDFAASMMDDADRLGL
jgi:hypothetical protein